MVATTASSPSSSKGLHIALWVVQVLLAFAFLGAGSMKLTTPYETLIANPQMGWAIGVGAVGVKIIGALEAAGAIGLILPAATRVLPFLTPLAAAGLALTMVGAVITHLARGEFMVAAPVVLGLLSALVAWGRFKKAPIAPRA